MGISVAKLWPGSTFVLLGCGPSLTAADIAFVRDKARVIAINSSYQLAPFADVLYACDGSWWAFHKGVPTFGGLKYSLDSSAAKWRGVQVLRNCGTRGLELDLTGLRTGNNSGYQAINLAVHLGAARIVLLGYDMQATGGRKHFDGARYQGGTRGDFKKWLMYFSDLVQPLQTLGVEVINCTPHSALTCFDRRPLHEVFDAVDTAPDLASQTTEVAT